MKGDESTNGTAKRFESRENTVAANRPQLVITFELCRADYNRDGFVDFFDFDDFVSCFEGVSCVAGQDADFNDDGFVDFFDFDDFVLAFEEGC